MFFSTVNCIRFFFFGKIGDVLNCCFILYTFFFFCNARISQCRQTCLALTIASGCTSAASLVEWRPKGHLCIRNTERNVCHAHYHLILLLGFLSIINSAVFSFCWLSATCYLKTRLLPVSQLTQTTSHATLYLNSMTTTRALSHLYMADPAMNSNSTQNDASVSGGVVRETSVPEPTVEKRAPSQSPRDIHGVKARPVASPAL